MDDKEVGKYWDENAENWIKLAKMGYDRCRDLINSPAFFKMLPDITNLNALFSYNVVNHILFTLKYS